MDWTASLGYWVRRWRKACDLTQKQLAEQVGCAVITIKKIETDQRRPSRQMAERLALYLTLSEAQRAKFIQVALGERPAYTLYLPEKPGATQRKSRGASKIPAQHTRLIGRRAEVEAIKDCIRRADVRLVTISGLGGVGKTCLAVQVAQELEPDFRDGVFFISLGPLNNPDLVVNAIAQTLEVHKSSGKSLQEDLTAHLADQDVLLVLDNFEHLTPAGYLVSELLSGTATLKILSTSRTPLHLSGEHNFVVQPFELPDPDESVSELERNDAVALFVERAQAAQPDFNLTPDNASGIAGVCQRLDGLPLAIELAAARVKVLSPRELLNGLESRLSLLTDGPRNAPVRQQTLSNTIAWSYELLAPAEKSLFTRLSIFRGGGTLEAIEAVCSVMRPSVLVEVLSVLVDHSLVGRREINIESRFSMLETVREYAAERLEREGGTDGVRQAHLFYYLDLARRAEPELTGEHESLWLDCLEIELDNINAALDWGLRETASPEVREAAALMAGTLWYFWFSRSLLDEGSEWCRRALACTPGKNRVRAKALMGMGGMTYRQFKQEYTEESRRYLEEAILLFRKYNDLPGLAEATHFLAHVELILCNYETAKKLFTDSLHLYQELNDDPNGYTTITDIGQVALFQGDYEIARFYFEKSLAWYRSQPLMVDLGRVLMHLGDLECISGSYRQAMLNYREALQVSSEVGMPLEIAGVVCKFGQVALHEEKASEARSIFLDNLEMQREIHNRYGMGNCLAGLAGVAVLGKEHERAAKLFGAAEALHESSGVLLPPDSASTWERDEKRLRAQLPHDLLESAWEEGKTSPLEQVLDGLVG